MACSVCENPMLSVATSMIDCGASFIEIADATGLLAADVEQHLAVCCKPPAPTNSVAEALTVSDERLRLLSERISTAIVQAGLSGDARAQLTGLSLAVRTELENRRRL